MKSSLYQIKDERNRFYPNLSSDNLKVNCFQRDPPLPPMNENRALPWMQK